MHSATLNGVELDVSSYTEDGGLPLPGLAEQNTLVVTADCRYSNSGEGLHRFEDPEDGQVYLYTQFEPADAKRMFACFDQPDLKATFTLHVVAPFDWQVVSNTGGRTIEAGAGGSQLVHFEPTKRISTYLVALIAGPYAKVTDSHEGIPLGLYCRASLAKYLDADELFRVTKQGFDFFHRVFDYPYPFDKYDQLFVPEFNAGAMENAGAVTFLEDYVFRSKVSRARYERRAETVLHELAHMWFGDLVTMRWWDDLWLNESFATYISTLCQAEATEYTTAWTTFANTEKAWAYAQDQLPSTHPIAADIPDVAAVEVNFDGITYAKGASVLKQLVAYVGRDEFLAGVRRYFRKHEYGNTTLADLLGAAVEESSGRDLSEWVDQWLRTSQVNTLRPVFELTDDGRYAELRHRADRRRRAPGAAQPPARGRPLQRGARRPDPHRPGGAGRRRRAHRGARAGRPPRRRPRAGQRRRPDLRQAAARRAVAGHPAHPDRRHPRPAGPRAVLVGRLGHDPRRRAARPRVGAAGARRRRRRDRDQRRPVAARPGADRAELLRRPVLGADRLDAAGRPRARRARGGPGRQRRAAAVVAHLRQRRPHRRARRGPARPARRVTRRSRAWTVDADARWAFLSGLVAIGAAGDAEIDAEAERDATATGVRRAATARALRPTAESKAETWQRAFHDDYGAQRRARGDAARASGTRRSGSSPPTYVERYFAEIRPLWDRRPGEIAKNAVQYLFPPVVEPRTIVGRRRLAGRRRPAPAAAPADLRGPGRDRPRAARPGARRRRPPLIRRPSGRRRGQEPSRSGRGAPAPSSGTLAAVRSGGRMCSVGVAQGGRVAGLVGHLPQPVDDAADEVAGGERAGHRQHGERAGAVRASDGRRPRR